MRNFTRWQERRSTTPVTLLGPIFNSIAAFLEREQAKGSDTRIWIIVIGLFYTGLVGAIDVSNAKGLSLEVFYLLGGAFVGWAAGGRAATLVAVASGILMCWSDSLSVARSSGPWAMCWNGLMRFTVFGATGWLAAWAGSLTRKLERTAHDRAGSLRSEVEDHKETTVRLREALELFRQATENISEVFWVSDPAKRRFAYVSKGFERVWGRPRQELYEAPDKWLEAVHSEDRERVTQATYSKLIAGDYDEEYRVVRPDSSVSWVHDRAFPLRNEKAEVYRIVGITEDITERKRAAQLLEAQCQVGTALSLTSDLKVGLQRLLEIATKLEGIDCGGVYLVETGSGALNLEAHLGLSADFVELISRYEADGAETSAMMKGGLRYIVGGSASDKREGGWKGERLRALTSVPLEHNGAVLGALNLGSRGYYEIPPQTRVVIETIAAQAAGAIVRIRAEESLRESEAHLRKLVTERFRLEAEILEISDREKARIGHDIHDGLCQQLVGAAFDANSLQQTLKSQGRPESAAARTIYSLLDEAITESRRVSRGLYPVRLETEGLASALQELASTTSERFKVRCTFEACAEGPDCGSTAATHLYRIAQEAVNNALKHSGAKNIRIDFTKSEDSIDLQIKDDGKGIKEGAPRGCGMGLHIMDYRARSIGGSLRIHGDGAGTTVSCQMPKTAE